MLWAWGSHAAPTGDAGEVRHGTQRPRVFLTCPRERQSFLSWQTDFAPRAFELA